MLRPLAVAAGLAVAALAPPAASAATMSTYPATVDSRGSFLLTGTGLTPGQYAQFAYSGAGTCAAAPGPGYEIPPNGTVTLQITPEPVWDSIRCLGTSTWTLGQGPGSAEPYVPTGATAGLNIVQGKGIKITPFVYVTRTPTLLTGLQPPVAGKLPSGKDTQWEILGLNPKKRYLLRYELTAGKATKGCKASFEDPAAGKPESDGTYLTYSYTSRPGGHWCKNATYTVTLLNRKGYTGGTKVTSTKVKIGA
jgi:hypothetical protein